MPDIAYLNGKWSPIASATVSVEDRGFQFGDGVYELIRTYNGKIFHIDEHIQRLYQSARQIQLAPRETAATLCQVIRQGCVKSGYPDVKIYIQITRGAAPRVHSFPKGCRPTVVMTFRKFDPVPDPIRKKGVSVITVDDIRWNWCNVKSLNLLPNVLAREQAVRAGAYDALFVQNGWVWEGAGSNFFAVFGKKVVTPPAGNRILSGITREVVIAQAKQQGISVQEKKISLTTLSHADEIFLTGTTVELLPVIRLNGEKVGTGKPGPVTRRLYRIFQDAL